MDALEMALEGLLPGDGWRLLVDGEVKQAGDEWKYADRSKEWFPIVCPGDVFRDTGERIVRRRL